MKTKEEIVYTGAFKEIFEGYIAYKISLGFNLEYREQRQLLKLNRHLNRYTTDNLKTTKQMVDDYIMTAHGLSSSTIHSYEGRIRQFALYARNLGYENIYVLPEHHIKVTTDFVPYIFSQEEMNAIFKATNELEVYPSCPNSRIFHQTIIRLLYGTGMRISEVLNLKIEDVDLTHNLLIIYESKGNVSRIIPFDKTVGYWLRKYHSVVFRPRDTYFFESRKGGVCNRCAVKNYFENRILVKAGIPRRPDNRGPRLHDLRHTYACHALDKMIKSGMDPFCALPYLSTYLGHKGIESTEKYLRLTAKRFDEITNSGHFIYEESLGGVHE